MPVGGFPSDFVMALAPALALIHWVKARVSTTYQGNERTPTHQQRAVNQTRLDDERKRLQDSRMDPLRSEARLQRLPVFPIYAPPHVSSSKYISLRAFLPTPPGRLPRSGTTHQALYAINDVAITFVARVKPADKSANALSANTSDSPNTDRFIFDVHMPTTPDT